jgi:lipoprotein-anchoring transpeptidase ErfK/SrfK
VRGQGGSSGCGRAGRGPVRGVSAAVSAAVLLVAGCSGGSSSGSATQGKEATAGPTAVPPASIAVYPVNRARSVRPDSKVSLTAKGGTFTTVKVTGGGKEVPGQVSTDSTRWTATSRLALDTQYTVQAAVTNRDGRTTRSTTTFTTLKVPESRQLRASSIAPLDGSVMGVAQPLAVGFSDPVKNRAAVQQALQVRTTPAVRGAWYWIDSENVHFRPRSFWPAGTKVTLDANIAGVDAGDGRWGAANRRISFSIGREQTITVDVKRLRMTVTRGGKALRTFKVTSGKKGWETRNGIKVLMDKETDKTWTNDAIDAPEDYTLHSNWAMRMTDSGEFVHDAPWSIGNLGERSASHGCVGMRPADARWLFTNTLVGDPIVVSGSPRPYTEISNRYADWNVPWARWSAGNA